MHEEKDAGSCSSLEPAPSLAGTSSADAPHSPLHPRAVVSVPGYAVTSDGRVFSVAWNWRGYGRRELAQCINQDGYPYVRLQERGGKRRLIPVHRLVADAFLPPRPSLNHETRHLNGNPRDNRVSNLAWGTKKENAADKERHGRTSRGERHAAAIRRGLRCVG